MIPPSLANHLSPITVFWPRFSAPKKGTRSAQLSTKPRAVTGGSPEPDRNSPGFWSRISSPPPPNHPLDFREKNLYFLVTLNHGPHQSRRKYSPKIKPRRKALGRQTFWGPRSHQWVHPRPSAGYYGSSGFRGKNRPRFHSLFNQRRHRQIF